jgi:hypothetical protein
MLKVFGIRHHGPGSARSLMRGLKAMEPDCILIEAPADAEEVIEYVLHPELTPPAAILIYAEKDLSKATFLPFAHFSPEWQAAQFGFSSGCEIRLMDLPMNIQFQLSPEVLASKVSSSADALPLIKDPMGYMAELAGYTDSERWWEATFEQTDNPALVFDTILELNYALREELKRPDTPMNQIREAHMRKCIRQAIKEGFEKIAVVCGAWHAPALHHHQRYMIKEDTRLLKGLKKSKTAATWIPWSYPQLAFQSGYAAGVVSPAWYELLFENREDTAVKWMAKVAALLRENGLDASPAHTIEATRLANALAALRGHSIAGLQELKEAVVAIFCEGREERLKLIEEKLVIGEALGKVPKDIPQSSIQADLEKCIKSAYLKKYYQSTIPEPKELDLRIASNLKASHLIHQLNILDINWGVPTESQKNDQGSYKENWILRWQPEFILRIINAGMWGNTVQSAASNKLLADAQKEQEIGQLVQLASAALLGGISEVFDQLSIRLSSAAAVTKDVFQLMEALPVLVDITRYGDTRRTDVQSVVSIIHQLFPRIVVGLPVAVMNIDYDLGKYYLDTILKNNHAIHLFGESEYLEEWDESLQKLAHNKAASPLIRGVATRLLFDKEKLDTSEVSTQMAFMLSQVSDVLEGGHWLEGFLNGNGLLLVYHQALWRILDDWVQMLEEDDFTSILPVLRRAFSDFTGPEREKLLSLSKRVDGHQAFREDDQPFDQARAKKVLPAIKALLGLE